MCRVVEGMAAVSGAVRRWIGPAQRASVRGACRPKRLTTASAGPRAPVASAAAPTWGTQQQRGGASARCSERQASLCHWVGLESTWQRLPHGGGSSTGREPGERAQSRWSRTLPGAGKALSREPGLRGKHTRGGQQVLPREADGSPMDRTPADAARDADLHAVGRLPPPREGARGVNGSERAATAPGMDSHFVERASMKQIVSLLAESPTVSIAPALIPGLLARIGALQPPRASATSATSAARNRSKEAGTLVRALLEHARGHLGSLDAPLVADVLSSAAFLVHIHGMHLWFSSGGAGGMGARSLLILARKADHLPPAHVARVLGALGRLDTGEQVLNA